MEGVSGGDGVPLIGMRWLDTLVDTETRAGARSAHAMSEAPVRELLELIDNPQYGYPSIHVTGTNGKGSVVSFASAILDALNVRSGSYVSPDLGDLYSRIKICGLPIEPGDLDAELYLIKGLVESFGLQVPTRFEAMTAAALGAFSSAGVEVAVVEVGMGGRRDATNVLNSGVVVVSSLGPDHLDVFGGSLESLAVEKAGIIQPDSELIVGDVPVGLLGTFTSMTAKAPQRLGTEILVSEDLAAVGGRRVSFRTHYGDHQEIFIPSIGVPQPRNFALATSAVEVLLERSVSDEVLMEAALSADLGGRTEIVSRHPVIVLDVAHNAPASSQLGATLRETFGHDAGWVVVAALTHGRSASDFLSGLGVSSIDRLISVDLGIEIQVDPYEIAETASKMGTTVSVADSTASALSIARTRLVEGQIVVVTGSHYLVSEAKRELANR